MNTARLVPKLFFSILIAGFFLSSPGLSHAATFTVDSTGDQPDAVIDGLCATSIGTCTLRAAGQEAHASEDPQDRITFNIAATDEGFLDLDGGVSDIQGRDDYWQINYAGKSQDLFKKAIILDVSTQTVNQADSNSRGPEIHIVFSQGIAASSQSPIATNLTTSSERLKSSSTPSVLGASTPQSHDESTLRYKGFIGSTSNKDWVLDPIVGIVKIGSYFYIAGDNKILKLDTNGDLVATFDKSAGGAQGLYFVTCLNTDGTYLYVCDGSNYSYSPNSTTAAKVQKYDTSGNYIATIGSYGSGLGQFTGVTDVTIDSSGNIYVVDPDLFRVSKFDFSGNFLLTWGSSGTGNAQFGSGTVLSGSSTLVRGGLGIDTDSGDNVWIADTGNRRIKKFDSSGNYVTGWSIVEAGEATGNMVGMTNRDLFIDSSDNIYSVKSQIFNNNSLGRVQKYNTSGTLLMTSWGRGGPEEHMFNQPHEIYLSGSTLYIVDNQLKYTSCIQLFDISGTHLGWWGANPTAGNNFAAATSVTVDGSGNIFATESNPMRSVKKLDSNYEGLEVWHVHAEGANITVNGGDLFNVNGVAVDSQGYVYATTSNTRKVNKIDPTTGEIILNWVMPVTGAITGIAIDGNDNIYVSQFTANVVRKYNTSGVLQSNIGSSGSGNGQFQAPRRVATDSQNNLYVVDSNLNRVQKFNSSGVYQLQWGSTGTGNSQFDAPFGLAVDEEDNVWVGDTGNQALKKFDSSGNFITKWDGVSLDIDEGGFANTVAMNNIDVDTNGNLYVVVNAFNLASGIQVYSYDQDGPAIDVTEFDSNVTVSTNPTLLGTISDPLSAITDLKFSFNSDYSDLQDCTADDAAFDSKSEDFSCPLGELPLGEYTIYLQSTDDANNTSQTSYTFTIQESSEEEPENPEDPGDPEDPETPAVESYVFSLIYPIGGAVVNDNTPKLDWEDLDEDSGLEFYDLYIDGKFIKNTGEVSEYTIPKSNPLKNGTYDWQVIGYQFVDSEAVEIARTSVETFKILVTTPPGNPEPPAVEPPVTGENPPKPTTPSLPNFLTNSKDFKVESLAPVAGIVAATATVALSTTLLTAGRDVLEKLGFVIGGIVPKKRRYWGIVFDAHKSQGIPFAVVRVYDQSQKLMNTTVTDIDGRYGIPMSEVGAYQIEVKAKGYKEYRKEISLVKNSLQEIVENIALERFNQKLDPIRTVFFYYMSEILILFRVMILVLMIAGFLYSFYVFVQFPILLNLIVLVVYLGLFILNLYQEFRYHRNVEGRVIDLDMRTGLPNTTVILYNSKGEQEDVRLTNSKGISKLRAKSGKYQVQALKSGYRISELESGKSSVELAVDERGYLTKAIFMKKDV